MSSYFKSELKRVAISKNTLIALILTIVLYFIGYYEFTDFRGFNVEGFKEIYDSIDVFIVIRKSYLSLLIPLIASMIFSDSYLLDLETGYLNFIYLRLPRKKYILIKILVNAIISGFVIVVSSILVFIILYLIFGINNNSLFNEVTGTFGLIYQENKFIYFLILIMTSFIFNVIFATLSLGLSPYLKNRYLTVVSSFAYYVISATIFISLKLFQLNATLLFTLNYLSAEMLIIYQIVLFLIGVILFYFGVLYKNEKNA